MVCKKCKDTGLTKIDCGPIDDGFIGTIQGYCDCDAGIDLAIEEMCFDCGCHKDETEEKALYPPPNWRKGDFRLCKNCLTSMNSPRARMEKLMFEGHNYHCANRIVWGDGWCECGNVFWHTTTGEELPIHW